MPRDTKKTSGLGHLLSVVDMLVLKYRSFVWCVVLQNISDILATKICKKNRFRNTINIPEKATETKEYIRLYIYKGEARLVI